MDDMDAQQAYGRAEQKVKPVVDRMGLEPVLRVSLTGDSAGLLALTGSAIGN